MEKLTSTLSGGLRVLLTLALVAAALWAGWRLWSHYQLDPWTRDGRVRADLVQISPDVPGLVTMVAVAHDQPIARGQLLFTIDRARFDLAVQQASDLVATQQAAIAVQKAAALSHRVLLAQAQREAARNDALGSLVATESVEQSHTKVAQETAALAQNDAALVQATAALRQAETALGVAKLNQARSEVHAPIDGILSEINLRVGDYVTPGKPAMALIDTSSIRVEGYFEETKLPRLTIGAKVEIRLMGEASPLHGHIQSIAAAIEDRERGPSANLLPNINPTFSWVRLAQRIPVRIAIDNPPKQIRLIAGRTASVALVETAEASK